MAGSDAVSGKSFADDGDLHVQLAVRRLQQAKLLELARPSGIDAGALAQLVDAEVVGLTLAERGRRALAARLCSAGREFFANHAQR